MYKPMGEFVSHEPEEESYVFFSEDEQYDYYCRIKRSEFERLATKRIMGSRVNNIKLNLPTTVGKGSPSWSIGIPIYNQIVVANTTFVVTCDCSGIAIGTFHKKWNIRLISND